MRKMNLLTKLILHALETKVTKINITNNQPGIGLMANILYPKSLTLSTILSI